MPLGESKLSRDLQTLREKLTALKGKHPRRTRVRHALFATSSRPDTHDDHTPESFGDLEQLVDELRKCIHDAEGRVAKHPLTGIAGGLVVGILIQRLLSRC